MRFSLADFCENATVKARKVTNGCCFMAANHKNIV
ncbi:hypothetical protein EM595_p0154 (plasmid) [Duffyella gerundensis]|uniref:Uncharacterized protein n=1 Tax=Duffyella gerundensis TaxID=1619313 RepID=A0A0U5L605_9GAMM|nr:hypothetical protein EM595_p0154 [Duffyella gerundensis]